MVEDRLDLSWNIRPIIPARIFNRTKANGIAIVLIAIDRWTIIEMMAPAKVMINNPFIIAINRIQRTNQWYNNTMNMKPILVWTNGNDQ